MTRTILGGALTLPLTCEKGFAVHAGLALSLPAGSSDRKSHDGTFVHYGMQPGSGTWDPEPSLTVRGIEDGFGWGAQVKYLVRLEDANASGFAFGDRFTANAWLSKPLGRSVSLSARVGLTGEGLRLGAEANLPLHQDLNGFQLPRDWELNISLSKMF